MKKLIILSLLSTTLVTSPAANIPDTEIPKTIKVIRTTKNTYRKAKSYIKDTACGIKNEITDISQDVAAQFKEVGQDIYSEAITPAFVTVKNNAKKVGSSIKNGAKDAYHKASNSNAVKKTKQIGIDLKDQVAEIGHTVYENGIRTPAIATSEKAAAIATAIKEKIIAAKNATAQAATDTKNSEFAQDMVDVGAQFKEVATDVAGFVKDKSSRIWNKTKDNVQAIREELAS